MQIKKGSTHSKGIGIVSRIASFAFLILGIILCLPYIFYTPEVYMSLLGFISITSFLFGLPMFFFGAITLFIPNIKNNDAFSSETDIARIRFSVETDKIWRK